jgi:hypothetical protein
MRAKPDDASSSDSDEGRQQLKRLVEGYATQTREFYEAVADLGAHISAGRSIDDAVAEIERRRSLCEAAGDELFCFLMPLPAMRSAIAGVDAGGQAEVEQSGPAE